MKLVLGVSGASGAPYAQRAMSFLAGPGRAAGIETDVVFTKTGRLVWQHELGTNPADFGLRIWPAGDMTAPFASGSSKYDAMLVIPCSAGAMARIAHGVSADLVGRAADVMLKERRPLVLVLRETPFSLIHLRNMEAVTMAGGIVMPAAPSFYSRPKSMEALLDTVVARAFDRIGIENDLVRRWTGLSEPSEVQDD
ncbi:MAG: UbiX family flavin prenyltransferase [Pseudomonadota bacterium]|nr:UbiX family flavin prenyltransferase [Pseudomonadota bacterium]